ncbi:MAG: sterol desaturase family protein [Idiomarina sp.]|nr:sterol desaturase family protein [Idiomarina sp.]
MSETTWRLSVFIGVLLVMVLWELASPKRQSRYSRKQRWPANLAIVVVDTVLLRLIAPVGLTGIALLASENSWGLFNSIGSELPFWLLVAVSIVLLDIAIYWQHRLFHRVPILWRMHRVHHADPDFDVTTGLRFHPAEIVLSFFIKAAAIFALGAPALAVIVFEIILNACSLFNHGNVALPKPMERVVRKVLITQELHRGLKEYRDSKVTTKLWGLLKIPFKSR